MDRSLSSHSMDNVLESMIFKAAQFPRTDSEDQFRKFLERIPSTTNLASHQGSMQSLPQAQQEQLQQQMAQFQQQSLQLASSGASVSTQLPEGGSLNVGGIPRVPSLDLLRQLVNQQQQQQQQQSPVSSKPPPASTPPVKEEADLPSFGTISRPVPSRPGSEAIRSSAEPALSSMASGLGISLPVTLSNFSQPLPIQSPVDPAVAAAATLQLGALPNVQPRKAEGGSGGKDSKAEVRRARRMLSNRESARRSRRRKQEHLGLLEEQILGLEEERDQLQAGMEKLEKQVAALADQNQLLKKENEDLRRQLGAEGKETTRGSNKRLCNGH